MPYLVGNQKHLDVVISRAAAAACLQSVPEWAAEAIAPNAQLCQSLQCAQLQQSFISKLPGLDLQCLQARHWSQVFGRSVVTNPADTERVSACS